MKYAVLRALLLLLLAANSTQAQFLVRGKVIDKDTKEPLCNATVACDCCHKGVMCTTCKEVTITAPTPASYMGKDLDNAEPVTLSEPSPKNGSHT